MPTDAKAVETLSFRQLRDATFPPDPYFIGEGILPKNGLMFIGGPPKAYKSFILNTIIYHLISGSNLFGAYRKPHGRAEMAFPVTPARRVLLLEQEIGFYDVRERFLPLWTALLPEQRQAFDEQVFIHSRDTTMNLGETAGCDRIKSIIDKVQPDVVCFDPMIEFHNLNENDSQSMALVLRNLDKLRNAYEFATIISHHHGKENVANPRTGGDLLRGSNVIYGKGDAYLSLKPVGRSNGIVRIEFTIRRAKPINDMSIFLDWTDLRAKFQQWASAKGSLTVTPTKDPGDEGPIQ